MYKIGLIFRDDDDYSNKAEFCNNNNLRIVEIEKDEGGRRFQIQEVPPPTDEELKLIEIRNLKRTLEKYKEDVEQVELFGMTREDYAQKKQACADIVVRLRQLEREVSNE